LPEDIASAVPIDDRVTRIGPTDSHDRGSTLTLGQEASDLALAFRSKLPSDHN